jgi:hypothetical protein
MGDNPQVFLHGMSVGIETYNRSSTKYLIHANQTLLIYHTHATTVSFFLKILNVTQIIKPQR